MLPCLVFLPERLHSGALITRAALSHAPVAFRERVYVSCSLAPLLCVLVQFCSALAFRFHAQGNTMSRVYIGRLSYRAREKDVERFFKGYGKILEVDLKNG